jgi:hypothetical protein
MSRDIENPAQGAMKTGSFSVWHWAIVMGWPVAFSHPVSAAGLVTLFAVGPFL